MRIWGREPAASRLGWGGDTRTSVSGVSIRIIAHICPRSAACRMSRPHFDRSENTRPTHTRQHALRMPEHRKHVATTEAWWKLLRSVELTTVNPAVTDDKQELQVLGRRSASVDRPCGILEQVV